MDAFYMMMDILLLVIIAVGAAFAINAMVDQLPRQLFRDMHQECLDFLSLDKRVEQPSVDFKSSSQCLSCHYTFLWWEKIPLLGYLLMKGHCAQCQNRIYLRPLLVDSLTVTISILLFILYGFSWGFLCLLILTYGLLIISFIDFEHQFIPDNIVLPLLWLGLLINCFNVFTPISSAVWGAAIAYAIFWCFRFIGLAVTGKEVLGLGDAKLLACFGAWLGYLALPFIIIFSIILLWGVLISQRLVSKHYSHLVPFSPMLAVAALITLIFGNVIIALMLHWIV